MTAAPEPYARLAQYVERRIAELALEYAEVCRRAEISDETLIKIRKGLKARASTYRKLERALYWQQGSIATVLAGGEPIPLRTAAETPEQESSHPAAPAFSPSEALRRMVRASARELGMTAGEVDEAMRLVRQDLSPPEFGKRRDLSDLVREARQASDMSVDEVAARAVDPESGRHVISASWLDRLERGALVPAEYPEYPQLDALTGVLNLDPRAVQDAAGVQFLGVHTIWSDDGQARGLSLDKLTDPEELAKAQELMRLYRRAPQRRDG